MHGNGFRAFEPLSGPPHLPPLPLVAPARLHKRSIPPARDRRIVCDVRVRWGASTSHRSHRHLEEVRCGFASSRLPATAMVVFIGVAPHTEWLDGQLATDRSGFILTGRDVPADNLAEFDGKQPLFLETSRPGIFAIGDVHSGSIKRVASAVGEGSMAVRLIHQRLGAI
jgi:thioredoxin reductase